MSKTPILAIVGSASERLAEERNYEPEITHFEEARLAARDIGRQAAIEGWHLQVYSLHEDFIEHEMVSGYADPNAGDPSQKKIFVHFAQGGNSPDPVPEAQTQFDCEFEGVPYAHERWEVAFYRPLIAASAVVVLGGGRSTLATGIVALAQRIPLFAVASFGGSGNVVWQAMEPGRDLPDDAHRMAMGNAWQGVTSAEKCLRSLNEQVAAKEREELDKIQSFEARQKEQAEQERRAEERNAQALQEETLRQQQAQKSRKQALTLFSTTGLAALIATAFCTYQWQDPQQLIPPLASILLGSMFAGIAGSSILGIMRWRRQPAPSSHLDVEVASLVPGAAAGLVAALIFVLGQVITLPEGVDSALKAQQLQRMVPFVALISLVAGLTWNRFFNRLAETDLPTHLPGTSPEV